MSHYSRSHLILSFESGQLEKENQNYLKISQLILDVLTPVVRKWLETHLAKKNREKLIEKYNTNISGLSTVQKTLEKYRNEFLNHVKHMIKFPDNFKIFDLTACAEIAGKLLGAELQKKRTSFMILKI